MTMRRGRSSVFRARWFAPSKRRRWRALPGWAGAGALCVASNLPALAAGAEIKARLKWLTSGASLPAEDVLRRQDGTPAYDHSGSLRVLARAEAGGAGSRDSQLRFIADYSLAWLSGDSCAVANAPQQTLEQIPTEDARRLMNLTWVIDDGRRHRAVHRLDRFAVEYRRPNLSVTLGRQVVSWGSGRVFQPMDLFNPFAPTTIDRDYKPGDDIALVERRFGNHDLQFLYVARRDHAGDIEDDVASYALKWHALFGGSEVEAVAARHYSDDFLGLTLRLPLGPTVLRTDVTGTRLDGDDTWRVSGIANVDLAFDLFGRSAFAFLEYFHNGFGVAELPASQADLPLPLLERLGRGELFNLQRDYLAFGATLQWHPLLTQSLTVISNLDDGSNLLQTSMNYEPSDFTRLQAGFTTALGDAGEEFGGAPVAPGVTSGGGTRGFLRFVYFR